MIDDFASGIDLRKSPMTAPAGTLRELVNATVTPGGEIEKRKTLTSLGVLPPGTSGLGFQGTNLVVFGTVASGVLGALPSYVTYQQLPLPGGQTIDRVLDVQIFGKKIYAIVRGSAGTTHHFYDGALVADVNAKGTNVRAHKSKLFGVDGSTLRSSAVRTPTDWTTTASGASAVDVTTEDAASGDLVGIEQYYGSLAAFGRTSVQIWDMDPDPALSRLRQTLGNIGLVAPNAVAAYGSGDVLFLSDTGIRSLRARDVSMSASVNDVGAPVDALVLDRRAVLSPALAEKIAALVDPLTGHFWLVWGSEVIVLSTYPNSKISAWSRFDFGAPVDYALTANTRIAIRMGDELFIYGSVPPASNPFAPTTPIGNDVSGLYDPTQVTIETPFMDAQRPATEKGWTGLDVSCTGTWDVYVNPAGPDAPWLKIATVAGPTWEEGRVPIDLRSTRLAVRFVSVGTGPATLASVALHHDLNEES